MRRRSFLAGTLAVLAACRSSADDDVLHVLAAASLAEVLPEVAASWSKTSEGMPVAFVADATSRLAAQIEAGAPADVFVAADAEWMDALEAERLVLAGTRHDLLGNRLVVVVARDAEDAPAELDALSRVDRLALAGPSVPAGRYARAALASAGALDEIERRIVAGDNVRTALAWVARGEADAAIVYATDARIEPRVRIAFEVPSHLHPPIVYPIAALATSKQPVAATRFVAHARSDAARALFRAAGFVPLP